MAPGVPNADKTTARKAVPPLNKLQHRRTYGDNIQNSQKQKPNKRKNPNPTRLHPDHRPVTPDVSFAKVCNNKSKPRCHHEEEAPANLQSIPIEKGQPLTLYLVLRVLKLGLEEDGATSEVEVNGSAGDITYEGDL
ncbi:hypothetical protein TNCV_2030621 [Trichonephila clavipes]|nr:hypothetical protein TNCV_2030621 [Trichonephila clavipes]